MQIVGLKCFSVCFHVLVCTITGGAHCMRLVVAAIDMSKSSR